MDRLVDQFLDVPLPAFDRLPVVDAHRDPEDDVQGRSGVLEPV